MGQYSRGDVVIAPVSIDERSMTKTRPAVVIGTVGQGEVYLCPVSSRPASDSPSVSISLDDFSRGGLDLFGESYVLASRVCRIRSGEIIGKKGRLTEETIMAILALVPQEHRPAGGRTKKNRLSGAGK